MSWWEFRGFWGILQRSPSFKKAMNDWGWTLPNSQRISFRDKYRMKTNMKSICYIYEFEWN